MTLAVLDGHFGLKLPSPEPRQLSSRRLDRLLGRCRQFFHHGPILEVKVPHALLNVFPLTRNGYSLVDHFLPAALRYVWLPAAHHRPQGCAAQRVAHALVGLQTCNDLGWLT